MNKERKVLKHSLVAVIVLMLLVTIITVFSGTRHVEAENIAVDNLTDLVTTINNSSEPTIIELVADISLTAGTHLQIPTGKEITLTSDTGSRKLIGVNGQDTIRVYANAKLTIDGITVTHAAGTTNGSGIQVQGFGTLIMNSGLITGNNKTALMSNGLGGGVNVTQNATFIMNGGTIRDNIVKKEGGGVNSNGNFIMNGGEICYNQSATGTGAADGGGGIYSYGGLVINGGKIHNNKAGNGAGVYLIGSFSINNAEIYGNEGINGGGVLIWDLGNASRTINKTSIHNNTASNQGGGVYVFKDPNGDYNINLTISDSKIENNTVSAGNGGAIHIPRTTNLVINGNSLICNNWASGSGGGIYSGDGSLQNIETGNQVMFLGNTAASAYEAPADVSGYPKLQFKTTSISTHLLNNADINYSGASSPSQMTIYYFVHHSDQKYVIVYPLGSTQKVLSAAATGVSRSGYDLVGWNTKGACCKVNVDYAIDEDITVNTNTVLYAVWQKRAVTYTLNYDANGGSGSYQLGDLTAATMVTVLSDVETGITNPGFSFLAWNSKADGSGSEYTVGQVLTITADLTLYAQWQRNVTVNITYNANGGLGTYSSTDIPAGTDYTILSPSNTGISKSGSTFVVWNTAADGSGSSYNPGQVITADNDLLLYAIWQDGTPLTQQLSLTYQPNGANGTPYIVLADKDVTLKVATLKDTGFTRPGYKFTGWNTNDDGSGIAYQPGSNLILNEETVLFAQWQANTQGPATGDRFKTEILITLTFSMILGILLISKRRKEEN